ncbi:type II toxin-antitoxin system VapC family toxin [Raoultibacter phocaeensis]|uniref:type II toxin-antitoxin system VapC family toxin n=1 Tax=Raoultibacter phocaeensis TaxID=2479841 RepID=UPI0015D61460|nr:type II toxin-antitoxin system VapC family toxin [Raoultibacter phocaeensis]
MARVLVDTNVWLDYHGIHETVDNEAFELVDRLSSCGDEICVTPMVLKDFYYLTGLNLKRKEFLEQGGVSERSARAAHEIAWSCTKQIMALSTILPVGSEECGEACALRSVHGDFEDNLLLAAARHCAVEYCATYDKALCRHIPDLCVSPRMLLDILSF